MYGKKVKLRAFFILLIFLSVALIIFLAFKALEENVVYFKSPTEVKNLSELETNKIRVGGMVKKNSIRTSDSEIIFTITDYKNELIVSFKGSVPNLFAEDKGVVAEGYLKDRYYLKAIKILAKHDENYMPPEINKALKENK